MEKCDLQFADGLWPLYFGLLETLADYIILPVEKLRNVYCFFFLTDITHPGLVIVISFFASVHEFPFQCFQSFQSGYFCTVVESLNVSISTLLNVSIPKPCDSFDPDESILPPF